MISNLEEEYPDPWYHKFFADEPPRPSPWGVFGNVLTYIVIVAVILIVIISVSLSRNALGTDPTNPSWFSSLERPPGMPPDYLFGIVWGVLYIGLLLGGIAAVNYFGRPRSITLTFVIVLLITLAWVVAFTVFESLVGGLIVLVVLIVATLILIWYVRPGNTRTPNVIPRYFPIIIFGLFLIWVCYATYLNAAYIGANPSAI